MKTHPAALASATRQRGILLIDCIVYIAVLTVVLAIGTKAFWRCWDANRALGRNARDVVVALNAGEQWRADVRAASGPIQLDNADGVERLRIPGSRGEIIYSLTRGELRRQGPAATEAVVLRKVESSRMQPDPRPHVAAWRWELALPGDRKDTGLRPLFTFEAVPGS
jgi:hypothetical protein